MKVDKRISKMVLPCCWGQCGCVTSFEDYIKSSIEKYYKKKLKNGFTDNKMLLRACTDEIVMATQLVIENISKTKDGVK